MEFILKSSAFKDNTLIPEKYTCDGEEISPELEWKNPPQGTKSFTLIVNDYDVPNKIWTHWLIYNIPHNVNKLSEGIQILPEPAKFGLNSWKQKSYGGPCPPAKLTHNYHFSLYALDAFLTLRGHATRVSVEKALQHHLLNKVVLMGTYQRKKSGQTSQQGKVDFEDAMTILRKKDVDQKIKEKAAKELKL